MNFLLFGSIAGFLSVALGAFATHSLRDILDDHALSIFQKGTTYQMYHALTLLLLGALEPRLGAKLRGVGISFTIGIVLFSGSLYALALTGQKWWGAVAPLGGAALLIGWAWLGWIANKSKPGL